MGSLKTLEAEARVQVRPRFPYRQKKRRFLDFKSIFLTALFKSLFFYHYRYGTQPPTFDAQFPERTQSLQHHYVTSQSDRAGPFFFVIILPHHLLSGSYCSVRQLIWSPYQKADVIVGTHGFVQRCLTLFVPKVQVSATLNQDLDAVHRKAGLQRHTERGFWATGA